MGRSSFSDSTLYQFINTTTGNRLSFRVKTSPDFQVIPVFPYNERDASDRTHTTCKCTGTFSIDFNTFNTDGDILDFIVLCRTSGK